MWLSVVSGWVQEKAGYLGYKLASARNLLCKDIFEPFWAQDETYLLRRLRKPS